MKISVLTDTIDSWFIPYGKELVKELSNLGHDTIYCFKKQDVRKGDICFLLSCVNIVNIEYLNRNKNNIVVHASDLPKGKGFSPLQWQILEGENEIVLTLFEAVKDVDAGPYYIKEKLLLDGSELYDELRHKLAEKIIQMCLNYVNHIDTLKPITQTGEQTFYRRRTIKDDQIDINKSILEQFNHFRIAENEKYPLWFKFKNNTYLVKIVKSNSND